MGAVIRSLFSGATLLVAVALAGIPVSRAAAPAAPAPVPTTPAAPETPQAPADALKVEAAIVPAPGPDGQPGPIRLGDPATLQITVEAPADAQVFVPSNPALGAFRILDGPQPVERTPIGDGRVRSVHRLPVLPLRLGVEPIDPIEIVFRLPDGSSGSVKTERLRPRIMGRLLNEQDPDLAPPPASVPVIVTNWLLIWILSGLGIAAVAALFTLVALRLLRNKLAAAAPPPPPRPADEVALEKLAALEGEGNLEPEALHAAVVDVMREYFGGRYGFDGLECTSAELLGFLAHVDLKTVTVSEVDDVLGAADLIKFARAVASDDEARALIGAVRRIVLETWEPPEEDEEEDDAPVRLDRAPVRLRLQAGLVDVALAAASALALMGGLWAASVLEWGWTAVLLMGLVMLLRDVAGPGSPGKVLLGLRLVRDDETQTRPGIGERLLRNLLLLVLPLGLPVETLVMLQHPLDQRVGDAWARTEVVLAERRVGREVRR